MSWKWGGVQHTCKAGFGLKFMFKSPILTDVTSRDGRNKHFEQIRLCDYNA